MRILRAADMGMCFGVRDALQVAEKITNPSQVTIHGELVHNPVVIHQLDAAGFSQSPEDARESIPPTPLVLITAHGASNKERERLHAHGKQLIDTTCPLVRRVHEAAMELAAEGRHVLLIGKPGHVEVRGIAEDLDGCDVISSPADVKIYRSRKLGIVCQTTTPSQLQEEVRRCVEARNPQADIRFIDTVCHPTKRRQNAMLDLLDRVDAVVVVGGRNSNNTRHLAELCRQHHVPVLHVTCADEVDPGWFDEATTVGLTAGTSTLDATIDQVYRRLGEIAASRKAQASSN